MKSPAIATMLSLRIGRGHSTLRRGAGPNGRGLANPLAVAEAPLDLANGTPTVPPVTAPQETTR